MELNITGKNELRAEVEKILENVQEGTRLSINKKTLEYLLFDEVVYNKKENLTLKLPVWSGEFLRKLDLSKVSFENVAWSLLTKPVENGYYHALAEHFDDEFKNKVVNNHFATKDDKQVNYSGTNAIPDFSKSWEAKNNDGKARIMNCNFSGMNLSKNKIDDFELIFDCDLSMTGIQVPTLQSLYDADLFETDLSYLDMKHITMDDLNYFLDIFDDSIFSNTGLNILYRLPLKLDNAEKLKFSQLLRYGVLDGCFINGKLFLSKTERETIAREKMKEYEKFKQKKIGSITSKIKSQIIDTKK